MAKICPQRILREAVRILNEADEQNGELVLNGVESHEVDDVIEELELLIKSLDKAGIINVETPA